MSASNAGLLQAQNLFTLGRLEEARQAAHELLSQQPSNPQALRLAARIEAEAENYTEARGHAQQALVIEQSAVSYHVLAMVERRAGDFAACIAACEAGLALAPENVNLYCTMSMAYAGPWVDNRTQRRSQHRTAAAANATRAAEQALHLDPAFRLGYYAAALAALASNDPFAAATVLEQGLELEPDWQAGHLLMSSIRGRQGMVKLASRHLVIAGQLDPSDTTALDRLRKIGGKRRRKGRWRQRVPWWITQEARDVLDRDAELDDLR